MPEQTSAHKWIEGTTTIILPPSPYVTTTVYTYPEVKYVSPLRTVTYVSPVRTTYVLGESHSILSRPAQYSRTTNLVSPSRVVTYTPVTTTTYQPETTTTTEYEKVVTYKPVTKTTSTHPVEYTSYVPTTTSVHNEIITTTTTSIFN